MGNVIGRDESSPRDDTLDANPAGMSSKLVCVARIPASKLVSVICIMHRVRMFLAKSHVRDEGGGGESVLSKMQEGEMASRLH